MEFNNFFEKLMNNPKDTLILREIFNLLIIGRQIYFSDKINVRLSAYDGFSDISSYLAFSKSIYEFLNNNFEILSEIFKILGIKLHKAQHSLSDNEKYSYFYYITYFDEAKEILKKTINFDRADIFILSALYLKTKMGLTYINLNEFIDDFINNPENLFYSNVNLEVLSRLFVKKDYRKGSTDSIKNQIKRKIGEKINKLSHFDFIHKIKSKTDKITLISPAPPIYRLIQQINVLKVK